MRRVLILGRMIPKLDKVIGRSDDTIELRELVENIISTLKSEDQIIDQSYEVISPSILGGGDLFPGFMDQLLGAHLVIVNLTEPSANVGYELGVVQALGKPYFYVCKEPVAPIYFQSEIGILGFHGARTYKGDQISHYDLRQFLKNAFQGASIPRRFASTQVSRYFDGLSLMDVSAASGLAAGFYRNSLRRFERPGGFFGRKCRGRFFTSGGPVDFEKVPEMFIAVHPPSGLKNTYVNDHAALVSFLNRKGFDVLDFNIEKGNDELDFRNFGGYVLAKRAGDEVQQPASLVVIEVPTFLYALQYSAYYNAYFNQNIEEDERSQRMDQQGEVLGSMIDGVKRALGAYYLHDREVPNESVKFRWLTLDQLADELPNISREYL